METVTASTPVKQPAMGAIARILSVLFSPQKTFEDIARKPGWAPPLVLLTLLSMGVSFAINQRVDWREVISRQIDAFPMASQLSPAQKELRIEAGARIAPITAFIGAAVGPVLSVMIVALAMWSAYTLVGGADTTLDKALSITSYALLTGLISGPLLVIVLYLRPPGTTDLQNPLVSNLAAFLPDHSAKWLFALCRSADLFSIWTVVLLGIGFAATSPTKLRGGKSYAIAFGVWAVYVAARVGLALIFS